MANFNPLNFIASHAGMNLADAIKEAYERGKMGAQSERETGKWLIDGHHIKCNKCGEYMCRKDYEGEVIPRNFCPNCGTKMEETEC